jgi:hypothetical protein
MRAMIVFFIALLAIPVVQVTVGPQFERSGAPVLIDRSSKVIFALGKRLHARDIEYPMRPKPKTS